MRRLLLLVVLVLGLAACGGSGAPKDALKITLAREGGLVPFTVTIAPGGAATFTGTPPSKPTSLTSAQDEALSQQVRAGFGKLKSLQCAQSSGDEATFLITAMNKTVAVRGGCEPGFNHLWDALTAALGFNS